MTADRLPASVADEADSSRRIAQGLRADAAHLLTEIDATKRRLAGLETARWHAIGKAAEIEREIRNIG